MRHVYVTAWCDQAHVTRKLEGADGLMAYWVDGPTFSPSQVSSNVFTPVRRESKKERSSTTSSDVIHSVAHFSRVKNGKRKGRKEMAWNVSETRSHGSMDLVPFRLYMNV